MTAKQFIKLFQLKTSVMVSRDDAALWHEVIKDFVGFSWKEAKSVLESIVAREGPDKSRLYYVQGVRRELIKKKNDEMKRSSIATPLRDLFNPEVYGKPTA